MKRIKKSYLWALALLLLLNVLGQSWYLRFDLTEDQRYTLSDEAKKTVIPFAETVTVDVLLGGDLPSEFVRLKEETIQLLDAYKAVNQQLEYHLIDPLEGENPQEIQAELQQIGLTPASVTTEENGKLSQEFVFPWAMVNYGNNTVKVQLLKNKLGSSNEDRINNSVQQLEYAFADAFTKLSTTRKKKIAVIKGNGELEDPYLADFLKTIQAYYNIGKFTLDSVSNQPKKTLQQLRQFDLALIAKPTQPFSEDEKYVLDQYVMNGGKTLWMVDQVVMALDSLFNDEGKGFATINDLNLNDLFFRYGVRINPVLVNDLYNTPIVLATGADANSDYNPLPWGYHPMVFSKNDHAINNNIEALRLQFTNTIDTLTNGSRKTVLLQSSPLSRTEGVPKEISLNSIMQNQKPEDFAGQGNLPLAVLIEGGFPSVYKNRIKPFSLADDKEAITHNQMIVIADGDIIRNQLRQGQPLELGFDKWTNGFYGNKEFLVNCVNYLLNDTGLINIRTKKVSIPLLDLKKISAQKGKWQLLTVGLPVLLVLLLGYGSQWWRKRANTA